MDIKMNINRYIKKLYALFFGPKRRSFAVLFAVLAALLFTTAALPAQATASEEAAAKTNVTALAAAPDAAAVNAVLNKVAAYQTAALTANAPGFGSEWTIIGLARGGALSDALKTTYLTNLQTAIAPLMAANNGELDPLASTTNSRVILALTSLGIDASNFNGLDLTAALANLDYVTHQGLNGAVYALLAADSGNYTIPTLPGGSSGTQTTRANLIQTLVGSQLAGGGWNLSGSTLDPDVTAMVLTALAPYEGKGYAGVDSAVQNGIAALSAIQGPSTGGFGGTSESTSQVILALNTLGIPLDDPRFVKNGQTAYDALMTFYTDMQTGGEGGFLHVAGGMINQMATDQGLLALVSEVRSLTGENTVYDMSDALGGGSGGTGNGGTTNNYYYSGDTTTTTSNSTAGNDSHNQTTTTNNNTTTTTTSTITTDSETTPAPAAVALGSSSDTPPPTAAELQASIDALRARVDAEDALIGNQSAVLKAATAADTAASAPHYMQTPSLRAVIGYLGAAACAALVGLFLGLRRRAVILLAGIVCAGGVCIWCFAPGFDPGSYAASGGNTPMAAQDAGGGSDAAASAADSSNASGASDSLDSGGAGVANQTTASAPAAPGASSGASSPGSGMAGGGTTTTTDTAAATSTSSSNPASPAPQHTVILSIDCTSLLGNMDKLNASKRGLVPASGMLMSARPVSFTAGETVYDILARECKASGIPMDSTNTPLYNSAYVKGIGNLYEFDAGPTSGWMFSVNGAFPSMGCAQVHLKDSDVIAWRYTCNLGADIGATGASQG